MVWHRATRDWILTPDAGTAARVQSTESVRRAAAAACCWVQSKEQQRARRRTGVGRSHRRRLVWVGWLLTWGPASGVRRRVDVVAWRTLGTAPVFRLYRLGYRERSPGLRAGLNCQLVPRCMLHTDCIMQNYPPVPLAATHVPPHEPRTHPITPPCSPRLLLVLLRI